MNSFIQNTMNGLANTARYALNQADLLRKYEKLFAEPVDGKNEPYGLSASGPSVYSWQKKDNIKCYAQSLEEARAIAMYAARQSGLSIVKKLPVTIENDTRTTYWFETATLKFEVVGSGLPATCNIVYDEVEVAAIEATTKKVARIVCGPDNLMATDADLEEAITE